MATLVRLCRASSLKKSLQIVYGQQLRCISTSKKNRDADTVIAPSECAQTTTEEKNWISYGFSTDDKNEDRHFLHATTFMGVTVCFILGGFLLAYRPDELGRDWAQREAFLELRRRERFNLPSVDPNYLPLSKIKLPSDEDLGDTEIII